MKFYLLEDNTHEAAFFKSCLGERGHEVQHFYRSVDLFDALHVGRPHLLVLDWMLPDVDGFVTLRRVRALCGPGLPVVMLSSLDKAESIVDAFEAGADDYLLKPMTRSVLIARLEGLLRRVGTPLTSDKPARQLLVSGPYRFDFTAQTVHVSDVPVVLTPKEMDLAWVLFNNAERFISKAELIACVWGKRAEISPHTVTQHIHVLRTKLKFREHGYQLGAVYGAGYRLTAPASLATEPAAGTVPAADPVSSGCDPESPTAVF